MYFLIHQPKMNGKNVEYSAILQCFTIFSNVRIINYTVKMLQLELVMRESEQTGIMRGPSNFTRLNPPPFKSRSSN